MKLRTLGGLLVEGAAYSREKPLLLLAYLCVEGPQPRRRLASLFWPEAANPMNSLAQHLIRLRPLAGAVREEGSRVAAAVECDACLLREHGRAGRHGDALDEYGGAFLEGVGVDLGPDLEEWLFDTREALGREARAAALALAERRLALGDRVGAAAGAEQAHGVPGAPPPDPAELPRLHRLLVAGGHPLAQTVRREAAELGVPLEEPRAAPAAPTLIGRAPEREALGRLAPGEVAWLSGPPGIGKSALLTALAAGGGWRVLPGRAGLPLATLEPLAPRLTGTADALAALADSRLRVAVDGWEDADDATRDVLTLAARQRPGAALLIAARDPPAFPADLHLALEPLAEADLAALPGALEATGGHPAYLAAFLRGVPPGRTLAAHLGTLPPPARDLYLTLAAQPAPDLAATRRALGLGAGELTQVLDHLTREGLCAPTGEIRAPGPARDLLTAQPAATALRHLHLARAHPTGTGWGHWHAARALWEEADLSAAARAAHAHAGETLRRGYPAQAAETLQDAPPTEEVRLLRAWALIHAGRSPEALQTLSGLLGTPDVLAARATALIRMGRDREALDLARAIPADRSAAHAHAELTFGHAARQHERLEEARAHYQTAVSLWRMIGDDREWLNAASVLAMLRSLLGEPLEQAFQEVLGATERLPALRGPVYQNYAHVLKQLGRFQEAGDAAHLAWEAYRQTGETEGMAGALNSMGVIAHLCGERPAAARLYREALSLTRATGNLRLLGLVASNLSELEGDLPGFADVLGLLEGAGHYAQAEFIRRNLTPDAFARIEPGHGAVTTPEAR